MVLPLNFNLNLNLNLNLFCVPLRIKILSLHFSFFILLNEDATDELRSARITADFLLTAYCLLLTVY